ncbi:hypothetical protein AVEN_181401-1, partial [Araneus ventricosus]
MLDSVGGANGVHFQRCQIFHAHLQLLRIFEQPDPHLSQLESHKQDSSDVPIKSNRGSINWEIGVAKGLVHHTQSIAPQKWHSSISLNAGPTCLTLLVETKSLPVEPVPDKCSLLIEQFEENLVPDKCSLLIEQFEEN